VIVQHTAHETKLDTVISTTYTTGVHNTQAACSPQTARIRPTRPCGKCVYFGTQRTFLC